MSTSLDENLDGRHRKVYNSNEKVLKLCGNRAGKESVKIVSFLFLRSIVACTLFGGIVFLLSHAYSSSLANMRGLSC